MNPKQLVPLAASAAPLAVAAPPLIFGAAIALGLYWLFASEDEPDETPGAEAKAGETQVGARTPLQARKRVMLEDLAGIFEHGERSLTRPEAVAALQARGIGKTAAYRALSPDGKFGAWFDYEPDGVITWEG